MLSAMTTACPGYKSYDIMPDGRVMVDGGYPEFAPNDPYLKPMLTNIQLHGERIIRYGTQYGIHPAWLLAIMCIESVPAGNANSCSPCSVCPGTCATGPCCAYGLMQFTHETALAYKVPGGGPGLMGKPDLAVEMACRYILDKAFKAPHKYGMDIVKLSASYNAGSWVCRAGATNWFGNREDNVGGNPSNYAEKTVRWVNTAIKMGFGVGGMTGGQTMNTVLGLALIAAAGYVWFKYGR
jgi:hypothetical protein